MKHIPMPTRMALKAIPVRRVDSEPVVGIDPFIVVGSCAGAVDVGAVLVVVVCCAGAAADTDVIVADALRSTIARPPSSHAAEVRLVRTRRRACFIGAPSPVDPHPPTYRSSAGPSALALRGEAAGRGEPRVLAVLSRTMTGPAHRRLHSHR